MAKKYEWYVIFHYDMVYRGTQYLKNHVLSRHTSHEYACKAAKKSGIGWSLAVKSENDVCVDCLKNPK